MDNDTLNSMNQLERTIVAVLQRLRGLAPAAVEDRGRGGDARGMGRVLGLHDADKRIDGCPGMAARQ